MQEKSVRYLDSPDSWLVKIAGFFALPAAMYLLWSVALGYLDLKTVWFSAVVGLGLVTLIFFAARKALTFATLCFSLFVGGAAQLWLTQPLWFPALRLRPADTADLAMVALVGLQALLAVFVLWRAGTFGRVLDLIREFGALRILLFLVISGAFSVSLQAYLPKAQTNAYFAHLLAGSALIGVNLLTVSAMLSQPPPFISNRGFHPLIPASFAFAASAALAFFAFERIPHVEDELIYLFQAQTFAHGAISVPAPPESAQAALEYYLLDVKDGRWFATTAPGWPGVLSIGVLLGVPWLVNPFLAALSVLLAHSVTTRLVNINMADIVAMLMATSPWFLGASASLMPHGLATSLMLLSWWLLLLAGKSIRNRLLCALLAGLAMGWVFTTRQMDGVLLGTLTGIWLLTKWRQPGGFPRVIAYSVGAILAGSVYLIHNFALTGHLLVSPLARYLTEQWHSGANSYGFGPDIGPPDGWGALDLAQGHSPFEGLVNTLHNLSALQLETFGWGIGSLALVLALLIWGRTSRVDRAMLVVALVTIGAMFFYWFSGSFYIGPRYWFGLFFPMLLLSASGFETVTHRLANLGVDANTAVNTLCVLCLFGVGAFTTWRGAQKYFEYGQYNAQIPHLNRAGAFGNALVFFKTDADPGAALFLNDPTFPEQKPIFIPDGGSAQNDEISAAFAGRETIFYSGE